MEIIHKMSHISELTDISRYKVLPEEKQPTLSSEGSDIFNLSLELKMHCLKNGLCMTCLKPLKKMRTGAGFCKREKTYCNTFRTKETREKYEK